MGLTRQVISGSPAHHLQCTPACMAGTLANSANLSNCNFKMHFEFEKCHNLHNFKHIAHSMPSVFTYHGYCIVGNLGYCGYQNWQEYTNSHCTHIKGERDMLINV